jgi:hypothetical protein
MAFYPDIKKHISPSAFDQWHNGRGSFVRSYFLGIKSPETSSMKGGKVIHALVEAGLLDVKHRYEYPETELTHMLDDVKVLGIPDSYGMNENGAVFVDYKSGRENTWDDTKLAGDLKMKLTAWLVWQKLNCPAGGTMGYIEYIPTIWNPIEKKVEYTGEPTLSAAKCFYSAEELTAFTQVIIDTVAAVNKEYEVWLNSTDEYVSQSDITEYAELDEQVKALGVRMEELKSRIAEQMSFGDKQTFPTAFGSFYFTEKKTYKYPDDLNITQFGITLGEAKEISAAAKAVEKKFETENAPEKVTKSLAFRATKSK